MLPRPGPLRGASSLLLASLKEESGRPVGRRSRPFRCPLFARHCVNGTRCVPSLQCVEMMTRWRLFPPKMPSINEAAKERLHSWATLGRVLFRSCRRRRRRCDWPLGAQCYASAGPSDSGADVRGDGRHRTPFFSSSPLHPLSFLRLTPKATASSLTPLNMVRRCVPGSG